ncbi:MULTISPECIES: distal tail protein Dit [unclassified Clostridioides]|uniref:distal tail protein Dit n=1 Tax=unclassified Clostridioides TaxID=2635829 RepID=UPI0006BBCA5A
MALQYCVSENELVSFQYGEINSRDFGIVITDINELASPERRFERIEIPGRNGSLILDEGCYSNFNLEIECYIDVDGKDINILSSEIKMWLQTDFSYKNLIISSDPNYYREAVCINKLDLEEVIKDLGYFKITFECKPLKKQLISNLITINESNSKLINTGMASYPLIKVFGNGDIELKINNEIIELTEVQGHIYIDCELMNAYKVDIHTNDIVNENSRMFGDFPTFEHGENIITYTGDVEKIEIEPRWVVL